MQNLSRRGGGATPRGGGSDERSTADGDTFFGRAEEEGRDGPRSGSAAHRSSRLHRHFHRANRRDFEDDFEDFDGERRRGATVVVSSGMMLSSAMNAANGQTGQRALVALALLFTVILYVGRSSGRIESMSAFRYEAAKAVAKPADRTKSHVLVTGGAGFIGSHGTLKLIEEGHVVTIIDNLSRGNEGALRALKREISRQGKSKRSLRVIHGDLGDVNVLNAAFDTSPKLDKVIHFAAVAYVGESMADPNKYYKNVTSNTATLLQAMDRFNVNELIYSSTCATYGNPEVLPITEKTPTVPINPYGKSKLFAEEAIRDYAFANPEFRAVILRYFNVFGSDPKGRLGEYPRPELRKHGRISGACFDAALGNIEHLLVMGTNHATRDGTCVRDFIHVTDLIDAHVLAMEKGTTNPPSLYNIGTGRGVSVKEFVEACKKVTKMPIKIVEQKEARPGDYAEVYANVDKIEKELGWKARYLDIEESLGHAWRWRKKHRNGY